MIFLANRGLSDLGEQCVAESAKENGSRDDALQILKDEMAKKSTATEEGERPGRQELSRGSGARDACAAGIEGSWSTF